MRFLIQKVKKANVKVDNIEVGKINYGLLVMIGIREGDTEALADYMINKLLNLRIFADKAAKMNLSLRDVNGELLIISQFTLYANCDKGNRPSFMEAAKPEEAEKIYNYIIKKIKNEIQKVETGIFGEYMQVELENDGPLTILLEKQNKWFKKWVIRFKSLGNYDEKFVFDDLVKGKIEFPENDQDVVIMKSDNLLPTYHFAHLVDDHLMHTTHVIRGDEWVSSIPLHVQLFEILGFKPVKYAHIAPITIKDAETGNIRKISKRKDPFFGVKYYDENGIPIEALHLYLATITNTNFEEWYINNPDKTIYDFEFSFDKQAVGGTSFDEAKLVNLCKTYFSRKSGADVYEETLKWALKHDSEYAEKLMANKEDMIKFFSIEKDGPRPRKDIAKYSDVKEEFSYAIDSMFESENFSKFDGDKTYDIDLVLDYVNNYLELDVDNETWFNKVREFASNNGYAASPKDYKKDPDSYKGHVGDICEAVRVMVTGRRQSPDLFSIMKILGKDRILKRIDLYKNYINK